MIFLHAKGLKMKLTKTRASEGAYFDEHGKRLEPCFDPEPKPKPKPTERLGLLVEEGRTNSTAHVGFDNVSWTSAPCR